MNELAPEDLRRSAVLSGLKMESTAEVEPLHVPISQQRAVEAVEFGIDMSFDGFNVYALGSPKTDKRRIVTEQINKVAAHQPKPADYCYIENFDDPGQPLLLELIGGEGRNFRRHMQQFITDVQILIPQALDSEDHREASRNFAREFQRIQTQNVTELEQEALQVGLAMMPTPNGFAFVPMSDGKVMEQDEFLALPASEREALQQAINQMTQKLVEKVQQYPSEQQKLVRDQRTLREETARKVTKRLLARMRILYEANEKILRHLDLCERELLENLDKVLAQRSEVHAYPFLEGAADPAHFYRRFEVNLIVDSGEVEGAPVIYESNPSLENLVGKLAHSVEFGNLVTDFTHIRPGVLHRANGGYLILDAERMLQKPFAWEALKRALNDHRVRIESVSQLLNMSYSVSLEPDPMPLKVKIILLGSRSLYQLLRVYDPDFDDLFKVMADFSDRVEWNEESVRAYVSLLSTIVKEAGIRDLNRGAIARVVEHCARQVSDQAYLSTHLSDIRDLVLEADYMAGLQACAQIDRDHIVSAIKKRTHRSDRFREMVHDNISRGIVKIETQGLRTGQVNGLSVVSIGQTQFGQPSRITATARIGKGEVVDIEREANLGGDIHSKAVMIVISYLGSRFAKDTPLSLRASLVFEQTYGVEGDSASVAEVCALLSAISELPIRQSVALTGSMDQYGNAQAIGGVNEKIEGFFSACKEAGLTGDQGVIIPRANVSHLMLEDDVVDAVAEGAFHIYVMENVDDALQILLAKDGKAVSMQEVECIVAERLAEFHAQSKLSIHVGDHDDA